MGGRLDGESTKFTEERAGYKRISRVNSIAAGKGRGLLFFSDRREEKQGQYGEASAAASQG